MKLPQTSSILKHFGGQRHALGIRAMGRITILHDVLNRLTYDAITGSFHTGEIEMAQQHLENVQLPDQSLTLMDRGFWNFPVLKSIRDNGYHFCIRLRSNLLICKTFMRRDVDDLCLNPKPPKRCKGFHPKDPFLKSFPARLVRYVAKDQVYALMTTLLDERYTAEDLSDLYHQRWQVEESFKVKKCRLEIEQLSGKKPEIVLQDFHARVLKESITVSMLLEVEERIEERTRNRKHRYQPCIT